MEKEIYGSLNTTIKLFYVHAGYAMGKVSEA